MTLAHFNFQASPSQKFFQMSFESSSCILANVVRCNIIETTLSRQVSSLVSLCNRANLLQTLQRVQQSGRASRRPSPLAFSGPPTRPSTVATAPEKNVRLGLGCDEGAHRPCSLVLMQTYGTSECWRLRLQAFGRKLSMLRQRAVSRDAL